MAQANETGNAGEKLPQLRLSRFYAARRATVFKAWSTAEHISRWFCPETFTIPHATVDMQINGPFEVCIRSPAGEEHWLRGRFVEIVPDARLVIDMRVADAAGQPLFDALTEVDFADAPGGTQMAVTQTYTLIDLTKAWMVQGAPEGWRSTLDKLARELARMEPRGEPGARSVAHGTFHLERTYAAPVARVWRALTDSEAKRKWFVGPPGQWQLIERHIDVRVGGSERLRGRFASGVVTTFDASYHDVIPNERLVYSYVMHLDDRKISVSLATIQLQGEGDTTTLKITEQGAFLDGHDDAGSREQGTGHLLDALGASLTD
jgi:uncharacterized protein YndB with AHSA1/START domain